MEWSLLSMLLREGSPWGTNHVSEREDKEEISTNLSVNHQQRRQNNNNNRRFGHSWPVTLLGEDNPWQQQCAKCSRKKVSGNPNNSCSGPKNIHFRGASPFGRSSFCCLLSGYHMRLLQITNQFLYKNHVCSLHDTWDSIQPYGWCCKSLHFHDCP